MSCTALLRQGQSEREGLAPPFCHGIDDCVKCGEWYAAFPGLESEEKQLVQFVRREFSDGSKG